jgi:hypothetical protein
MTPDRIGGCCGKRCNTQASISLSRMPVLGFERVAIGALRRALRLIAFSRTTTLQTLDDDGL